MSSSNKVSQCEDMCPISERKERIELRDIHILEKLLPDYKGMIKKYQRSSADHKLKIPDRIRTPQTLLKTIEYIEDNIMIQDRNQKNLSYEITIVNASTASSTIKPLESFMKTSNSHITNQMNTQANQVIPEVDILTIYLFIWDRYRMIAKDFILQSPPHFSELFFWIESYERMIRWHILISYRLHNHSEYQNLHAQQNLESLNNLLKTLTSQLYNYSSSSKYNEYIAHQDSASSSSCSQNNSDHVSNENNNNNNNNNNVTIQSNSGDSSGNQSTYPSNSYGSSSSIKTNDAFKNMPEFISYMILLNFTASDGCRLSEVLKTSLFPASINNSNNRNNDSCVSRVDDQPVALKVDGSNNHSKIDKSAEISPSLSSSPTLLLSSDIIQLVLKLCTANQRKDIYLFFKLIRYISDTIKNEQFKSVSKTEPTATTENTTSTNDLHHLNLEATNQNNTINISIIYTMFLCLLQPTIHTMRIHTMDCFYSKTYLKNSELPFDFLMHLFLIPTTIEFLEFITKVCHLSVNINSKNVVLTILLEDNANDNINATTASTATSTSNTTAIAIASSNKSNITKEEKINVEAMLAQADGKQKLAKAIYDILQPTPAATHNSSSEVSSNGRNNIYTALESVDMIIETYSYALVCRSVIK